MAAPKTPMALVRLPVMPAGTATAWARMSIMGWFLTGGWFFRRARNVARSRREIVSVARRTCGSMLVIMGMIAGSVIAAFMITEKSNID
jgi:hypothetical protein